MQHGQEPSIINDPERTEINHICSCCSWKVNRLAAFFKKKEDCLTDTYLAACTLSAKEQSTEQLLAVNFASDRIGISKAQAMHFVCWHDRYG